MSWTIIRRLAIFGAPVGLGILAAVHPMTPQDDVAVWNLIHTLQVPLSALLGIGVLLILRGIADPAARLARTAIIPWVAFFAAFDGVAGLATGWLAHYGHVHPEAADLMVLAGASMADSPFIGIVLPFGAVAFALVVFGSLAAALQRAGAPLLAIAPLAVGGVLWTLVHPIIGAPAMLLFIFGAAFIELAGREVPSVASPTVVRA